MYICVNIYTHVFILKTLNVTKVSGIARSKNTKKKFNHAQGNRQHIVCITFFL